MKLIVDSPKYDPYNGSLIGYHLSMSAENGDYRGRYYDKATYDQLTKAESKPEVIKPEVKLESVKEPDPESMPQPAEPAKRKAGRPKL